MKPHLQLDVCVRETAQPDSAGRQVSLLTADEMECLLTQGASAARAPPQSFTPQCTQFEALLLD